MQKFTYSKIFIAIQGCKPQDIFEICTCFDLRGTDWAETNYGHPDNTLSWESDLK